MHRTRCTQGRKEPVCPRMVCEIRMGAGADVSVGGVVSEGGEPLLPTLVCFFLWSGRKARENGAHTGVKELLEEPLA